MSAAELLQNIHVILKAASTKCFVMDETFPAKFFEADPSKIYTSYLKFVEKRLGEDGVTIKDEDQLEVVTVSQKFDSNAYKPEKNGFYKLYHDITLVCLILIHYYAPGTRSYQMVDKFYRFATELLLRECYRLGIQITSLEKEIVETIDDEEDNEKNELSTAISQDFIKISTYYKLPAVQTYHIRTKDQDLFSSIINKSLLDHRPQELPNSNFEINNIIPQTNLLEDAPKLGFIAANTSNIPDPTLPPTEMMSRFLHPNWYALPTTTWLKYGNFDTWAPSFNESGTVIDSTTRGTMWLKKIGYSNVVNENEEAVAADPNTSNDSATAVDKSETDSQMENKEKDTTITSASDETTTEKTTEGAHEDTEPTKNKPVIKLENIYKWQPGNYIKSDEIESFEKGTQEKLINETLQKLQSMRKERVLNKVSKPKKEETQLYYKVKRMLREVVLNKQVSNIPMNHAKYMPVLQTNYNGSVPVVRSQPGRRRKHRK